MIPPASCVPVLIIRIPRGCGGDPTCRHFIRTIPALVYDDKDVEDVDTSQEDHIYDECRYVCMEHPLNPRQNMATQKQLAGDDPLNQREPKRDDKYTFYRL